MGPYWLRVRADLCGRKETKNQFEMKTIYKGLGIYNTDGSGHFSGIDLDGIERQSCARCVATRVRVTIKEVRHVSARTKQIIRDVTMAFIGATVATVAAILW